MQINRIFEITYMLLNHEQVTAKTLSEKFDVSVRTIYRDIDRMSQAGIPVYTERGKGGGISLLSVCQPQKNTRNQEKRKQSSIGLQNPNIRHFGTDIQYANEQPGNRNTSAL